jgi:transcription elongation factor GreA
MNSELSSEYLSEKTKQDLEKELEYLMKNKRREISEMLEESISLGDISENAEYQEAKDAQLFNEKRIAEIEDLLSRAIVVSQIKKVRIKIDLGCFVVIKKCKSNETCKYQVVGSGEADPSRNKISNESPLGISLLGRKKGEKVKVLTPKGKIEYTIIEIM